MKYYTNLFSQMLHVIKRNDFEKLVREHKAEAHSKGFSSWEHFAAMLFAQLGRAQSLREISYGLRTCLGKLNHLGMKKAPPRSTLSYANNHRPWELFRSVFYQTLNQCQIIAPDHKFRFKNKLLSLDTTVIDLCLSLFPWAEYRRTKGAVKLHLLLDHDGYLPVYAHITEGKIHEINIARNLSLPAGSIVVYDRGYVDYSFFQKCTDNDVYFVTRQKKNAKYDVVQEHKIPQRRNILSDQTIKVSGYYSVKKCASLLRRIVVWDAAKKKEIVLWTNHFKFGASTIAAIYKERWQIEIFFKTIKQNLRIKTFIGTTAIALKTQIWTALIAILLIKYMKLRSQVNWSLSNLIAMLRFNLFTYRDLWKWLQNPYDIKPIGPLIEQLEIVF
jgi:hypothetical protein